MNTRSFTLQPSKSIGPVSAVYIAAEKSMCIMTLSHGAGAGMNHPFMETLANTLANVGIATLRFNFPFAENKKKRPDLPPIAHKTVEAAIRHANESFPALPLFVAGKSFGGRMSSQHLALHDNRSVRGIIFYGFPLHPPGKPSTERAHHLSDISEPMLFLQGTRDALANPDLMEEVCAKLPKATLVKIEGADHSFKAGKRDMVQILADATFAWMKDVIKV
jgi:predicted alpha/beta-hydrolase family hydrolase